METKTTIKALAAQVAAANLTLADKVAMLRYLADGKPPAVVEAELSRQSLFLGFDLAPGTTLKDLLLTGGLLIPRKERLTDPDKIFHCIGLYKKLEQAAVVTGAELRPLLCYTTSWGVNEIMKIIWYSYFSDEVSLYSEINPGYMIRTRMELLNGFRQAGSAPSKPGEGS